MKHHDSLSFPTKFALFVTIFLWSSAFVGIRMGLQDYSPGGLALFRFLIASVSLYVICLSLPKRPKIIFKDKLKLLAIGAITVGGYHLGLNYGEQTVSASIASFIISQSPIFSTLLAIIFLKERLPLLGILGMVVSVIGVSVILLSHTEEINFALDSSYVLVAAFLGSIYSVAQKFFVHQYHPIEVTAYLVWGSLFILIFYSLPLSHEIFHASWRATFATIYLGIFPAAIAYLTWSYVLKKIPASRAVNYLYWMPILTLILGWIALGEAPVFLSLLGGLIALLGVWVLNHSYRKVITPVMIEEQCITTK